MGAVYTQLSITERYKINVGGMQRFLLMRWLEFRWKGV
jgi:hypothetical protein